MTRQLTLAEKVALLLEHGEAQGLAITSDAIAEATKEHGNTIRQICLGEKTNPGLRTLLALTEYFGVSLAYFESTTITECRSFLTGATPLRLQDDLVLRTAGLSEEGLKTVLNLIDYVRRAEKLSPNQE